MAAVRLNWWKCSADDGSAIHYYEIIARNDGDMLIMEAHERGRMEGQKAAPLLPTFGSKSASAAYRFMMMMDLTVSMRRGGR